MKIYRFLFFFFLVLLDSLVFTSSAHASHSPTLILSEIRCATGDSEKFIELYNDSDQCIPAEETKKYQLKKNGSDSINILPAKDIPAKSYFLWAKSSSGPCNADTCTSASIVSDNSISLFYNKESVALDSVTCTSHIKGESLTRDLQTRTWSPSSLPSPQKITEGNCPVPPPSEPDPPTSSSPEPSPLAAIRLNEIFPNPKEKGEANEFIELYNDSEKTVSLIGWSIKKDRSESGKYTIKTQDFTGGTDILAGEFFLIPRQISGFIMANANKIISLYNPDGKEMSFVQYKTTKEGVSLNYTPAGWRGGTPTPGSMNILNTLPETKEKVPKKGYRGVRISMSTKGKDADGDTLKYVWDFGDGHKSYKKETSHIYERNGIYNVTLTTSDGNEDVVEIFPLKIQSYDPPEIRITSLIPNPSGRDTDNEWIALQNREKKMVNLKGFSIATGSKKLINHPIREDFILEPKQETKITHLQAAFTLPNQKGKIELRAPDGKPLQKIAYKLEKSAAEDAVYSKKKGERWKFEEIKILPTDTGSSDTSQESTDEFSTTEDIPQEKVLDETTEESDAIPQIPPASGPASEEPLRPRPANLLSYGTNLKLPDSIAFTPHDTITPLIHLEEGSPETDSDLLTHINAALNSFLNQQSKDE